MFYGKYLVCFGYFFNFFGTMSQAKQRKLIRIEDPDDYLSGLDFPDRVVCENVLIFERLSRSSLQQKHLGRLNYRVDRMHSRYVLIRVIQTAGVISVDGRSLTLDEGDCILLAPFQFHHFINTEKEEIDWTFITFELAQGRELVSGLSHRVVPLDKVMCGFWKDCLSVWSDADCQRFEIFPVLERLLMHLAFKAKTFSASQHVKLVGEGRDDWIVRVEELVLLSVRRGWTLEEVARRVGISGRQLRSRFEKSMGITLRDYRASFQLHTALSYMRDTQLNLADIAELSGFHSQPAFTRFVKRITGVSPRELRSNLAQR